MESPSELRLYECSVLMGIPPKMASDMSLSFRITCGTLMSRSVNQSESISWSALNFIVSWMGEGKGEATLIRDSLLGLCEWEIIVTLLTPDINHILTIH